MYDSDERARLIVLSGRDVNALGFMTVGYFI